MGSHLKTHSKSCLNSQGINWLSYSRRRVHMWTGGMEEKLNVIGWKSLTDILCYLFFILFNTSYMKFIGD